jgi:long-chain acyl-CoA synthetase
LLGSNGQNIYPEEIEDKLNSMDMVNESVIVQRGDKLVGLVYPDYDEARELNLTREGIEQVMKQNLQLLNTVLPGYCRLSALELHEEFEKTPKKSIKRFLYQEN